MGGDAKVNNSARREFDDEEGVDLPEEQVDSWEKVTGPDHLGVILEESWPILTMGGAGACQADVLLDCGLGEPDAEFHEFTTDALHAPETFLPGNLLDQGDGLLGDSGAPTPVAGLEPPEQPEALAMPAQERIGLEDEEGFLPTVDPAGEEDEPKAISWGEPWLANLAVEDDELLAEEGVLRNECGVAASEIEGRAEKDSVARRPGEIEGSQFQRCQCGAYAPNKPVD